MGLNVPERKSYGQSIQLPTLTGNQTSLEGLNVVISKGSGLFGYETRASLNGDYTMEFGRDLYRSLRLILAAMELGGVGASDFISKTTLVQAAQGYLRYMREDGELPHQVGTKEQGYPFPIVESDGIGKHFGAVDTMADAMHVLAMMYEKGIGDQKFRDATVLPYTRMVGWTLQNAEEHDGSIGFTFVSTHDSEMDNYHEGTLQDGRSSILLPSGAFPPHPIKYVREQAAYAQELFRAGQLLRGFNDGLADKAILMGGKLQQQFNKLFILEDDRGFGVARAIAADGQKISTANIDSLLAITTSMNGGTILEPSHEKHFMPLVRRLLDDLQTPYGVLRTQGLDATVEKGYTYHGPLTIWPVLNADFVSNADQHVSAPLGSMKPKHRAELATYADTVARGLTGIAIESASPHEVYEIKSSGTIGRYHELKPQSDTMFTSCTIQAFTTAGLVYLAERFSRMGVKEIQSQVIYFTKELL